MNKPYVIIHTHTSMDGNIDSMDLVEFKQASQVYQEISLDPEKQLFNIDGYLNGKTTTQENTTFYREPELDENAPEVPEGDYIANSDAPMYYLSIDARGELGFESNTYGYGGVDSHIVEVLTNQASNAYKHFLREKEISYIIAGDNQIDFEVMLDKFYNLFNIKRMMLGGGGTLNWSLIQAGLVDEVSMILAPIANGDPNAPRFFTAKEPYTTVEEKSFKLKSVQVLDPDIVWIRYETK